MISKTKVIAELKKLGIAVKNDRIKKSDVAAALSALSANSGHGKMHQFEFIVVEKRPAGADHPQASRMLEAVEFTPDGLVKIAGQPRYDEFPVTFTLLDKPEQNTARVVKVGPKHFWIQLEQPSKDMARFT